MSVVGGQLETKRQIVVKAAKHIERIFVISDDY